MTEMHNTSFVLITGRNDRVPTAIDTLESIRVHCPALHSVFLPDDTWQEFKAWHTKPDEIAWHRSMLLLALERGHLARLTDPVHRYLIENGAVRPDVRRQYIMDLRERWMLNSDPHERNRGSGIFTGRIAELQFAEWIETTRGWTIIGLEALREGVDVEAQDESGVATAFEIKAIGTEHDDFEMILRSIAQGPSVGSVSPYAAVNYLLFRVYEAARQLVRFHGRRIAVVILGDINRRRFDCQLQNHWVDWSNPSFLSADPTWEAFLQRQERRYPGIRTDLASAMRKIDAVWIMNRLEGYVYRPEYEIPTVRV